MYSLMYHTYFIIMYNVHKMAQFHNIKLFPTLFSESKPNCALLQPVFRTNDSKVPIHFSESKPSCALQCS